MVGKEGREDSGWLRTLQEARAGLPGQDGWARPTSLPWETDQSEQAGLGRREEAQLSAPKAPGSQWVPVLG